MYVKCKLLLQLFNKKFNKFGFSVPLKVHNAAKNSQENVLDG